MTPRILAFCAVEDRVPQIRRAAAVGALERLANRWGMSLRSVEHDGWKVHLVHRGSIDLDRGGKPLIVGPPLPCEDPEKDRHLRLELTSEGIRTSTDYTGSVPVYYSSREGWVVSNVEPAVVLGSGSERDDLSLESLFGLLLLSHFLWDETLYRHILQQLPDCRATFRSGAHVPSEEKLHRLSSRRVRSGRPIETIASELNELNKRLVLDALRPHREVVLPLSGGYDSRMILVAAAEDPSLRDRLKCFTYGPKMSIEVQAAKRLARAYGVWWRHVELPCRFLERRYLEAIGDIFGGSLHFHGMYQIEFAEVIRPFLEHPDDAVLTSGYMTGVPAGQHVSLMLDGGNESLLAMFNRFGQSRRWTPESLSAEVNGLSPGMADHLEARLRQAFEHIDGDDTQRSVVCDVLTRQRNFISYYPRTIEWLLPHVAPHMNPEYANFFLSLDDGSLRDRFAIEEMFVRHHPRAAAVFSNSNGLRSLSSGFHERMFRVASWMRAHGLRPLIPSTWRNQPLALDRQAVAHSGVDSFWPLTSESVRNGTMRGLLRPERFEAEIRSALAGDVGSCDRLCRLQALAWSLESLKRST